MTSQAAYIEAAAGLIAEFNPSAARVFVSQPFRREAIAEAFRAGFRRHSDYTAMVCALVEKTARLDRLNRAVEASVMQAPTVFEYILKSFAPVAPEAALERLNDAHQAFLRAAPFEVAPSAHIHLSNVLLDRCFDAGMSHDEPDHEAWAAGRVARWLVEA